MVRGSDSTGNKMAITVEEVFYIRQEIVAQSNAKKIGETVKMLVIEIDQQKYKDYLSSESANLCQNAMLSPRGYKGYGSG